MERVILILRIPYIVWTSGYKTNLKGTEIYTQQMHKISYIGPLLKHYCDEDSLMMAPKECKTSRRSVCVSVAYIFQCM
jgi:hypothetical protein